MGSASSSVLSVSKLRVGQEAYHLSGVAQSLDAYYTGSGEAAGAWVGGSAARLGLHGEVDPDDLRAVLAGLAPGTGGLTPNGENQRPSARRVPGFDLTFKAPKSASVLYAVSDDPRVQGAVIDAGEAAMRAAVGWMEEHTVRVRRGSNNRAFLAAHPDLPAAREVTTNGVIAAGFRHRTSRAGDPLLHWHVLVANLAQGVDGRWSSVVHPNLYRHAKAAGEVFQAVFRAELSASLGVEWRPGRHVPEIAGIPQALIDGFSKRSHQIEDWLAATGTPDTPEGRQQAVLATRRRKPEVEHGRFDDDWKTEAIAAGWGPEAAEALVAWYAGRQGPGEKEVPWRAADVVFDEDGAPMHVERIVDAEEWVAGLLRTLTATDTTFSLSDLHEAIAASQGAGATVETIERIAHTVLASPHTIPVSEATWTSREVLDLEERFIASLDHTATPLEKPASNPMLGVDQAEAVDTLVSTGSAVSVLIGPAGTGKTFTVAAIADAYRAGGYHVLGAAPSARAALELDAVGLSSRTLHRLLDDWRTGLEHPTAGSLLVIDEAGMADLRTLEATVTAQTAVGGRVLLVGDHHQLPEVGAGGGFAWAADHSVCVTELSVNRRQQQEWEQDALQHLRDGDVTTAVDAYLAHERVQVASDAQSMIDTAVDAWFAARERGERVVLLAGTTATVDSLNGAIARHLHATGELTGASVSYAGREFRLGERVVIRRNGTEHSLDGTPITIANGQAGTVQSLTSEGLAIALDSGPTVVLTERYLKRGGHVDHGWALTTHRAQGGTWDTAIAVGVDGLYREGAYVQLSRGAGHNTLVVTDTEIADLHRSARAELARHDSALPLPGEQPGDVRDELIDRLSRSASKRLAHHDQQDLAAVDHLARTLGVPTLERLLESARHAERVADAVCNEHGPDLVALAERITEVATHVALGIRVSPIDRHNVGTVIGRDDARSTITVHFVSDSGREATRTFGLDELRLLDTTALRQLPDHARLIINDLTERADRWSSTLQALGVEPGDAERYQRAITHAVDAATHRLLADPPEWLITALGDRPADVAGVVTYDDTVRTIAARLLRTGHEALVERNDGNHDGLIERIGEVRAWLENSDRLTPESMATRAPAELHDRLAGLDMILAGAPPDVHQFLDQLLAGQLSMDDTEALLADLVERDGERARWIVEHWPHVVEYREIKVELAAAGSVSLPAFNADRSSADGLLDL